MGKTEHLGPVDEYSGLPLPIIPAEPPRSLSSKLQREYKRHDDHHAFFRNADLVTEGERVIRHSRIQYGPRWAHDKYHGFYENGVPLPRTEQEQFTLGVLAVAGYIPENGVNISGKDPVSELLTPDMREVMHATIGPERHYSKVTGRDLYHMRRGIFFMNHALSQGFDHVRQTLLEEFVEIMDRHDDNHERKEKLGIFIVDMAFKRAVEPIEETYRSARQLGFIHPTQPKHPVGLLHTTVQGYQPDYFKLLARRIKMADEAKVA